MRCVVKGIDIGAALHYHEVYADYLNGIECDGAFIKELKNRRES